MKRLLVVALMCVFALSIGMMMACEDRPGDSHPVPAPLVYHGDTYDVEVVKYGNGVYYFHGIQSDFGKALSAFISDQRHRSSTGQQGCEVKAIAPNDTGGYGTTVGYFVICFGYVD